LEWLVLCAVPVGDDVAWALAPAGSRVSATPPIAVTIMVVMPTSALR
jgi:hypothetical protein